jgi:hypothetical protein
VAPDTAFQLRLIPPAEAAACKPPGVGIFTVTVGGVSSQLCPPELRVSLKGITVPEGQSDDTVNRYVTLKEAPESKVPRFMEDG